MSLTTSIQSFLVSEGKVLVGGDIVLRSAYPVGTTSQIFVQLSNEGHTFVEEQQVQAVFRNTNGSNTSPANVRIVSDKFPLYGEVLIERGVFSLTSGGIYVEQDFLNRIKATVGDDVILGDKKLRVLGILTKEPDNLSVGVSFTPRVILLKNDFSETGLNLAQSRASYKVYIKESERKKLTTLEIEALREYAKENKLRFDDATDGPNRLIRGLSSVSTFIGIVITIALFLVTVNIAANLVYVLARFKKTIALLKTFGATNRQIQIIYICILGLIGGAAGFLGAIVGAYTVTFFLPQLAGLLGVTIIPTNEILIGLGGGVFGIVFILSSSVPFLSSLRSVLPKELLSTTSSFDTTISLRRVLLFLPIPLLLTALLYVVSKDILLVLYSVLGLIVVFGFFAMLSYFIIETLYRYRRTFPFIASAVVSFLKWRGFQTWITSASIMTALCGVFIVSAVEKNIAQNLDQNISRTAPSLYLVDITKSQIDSVKTIVGESFREYPIIRGRLLSVNERDMTQSENPGITREFNMTYRNTLIEGERVLDGEFGEKYSGKNVVSIEKDFADELGGVALGDTVKVFIQGITIEAVVTSIRAVDSSSGIPFFYLVFAPEVLSDFPASYFGTSNKKGEDMERVIRTLGVEHPNVIPIETKKILETVESIVNNVVLVVTLTSIPSIILGLMLIIIMISQSMYERKGDVLILRAFGLERKKITLLFIIEAGLFILISGIIAYFVAHSVAFLLNYFVFSFDVFAFSIRPLFMIVVSIVIVVLFAYILSRGIAKESLKKLLSEK